MNEVQARWAIQRWQDTVGDHVDVRLIPAVADPSAPDGEWRIHLPGDPATRTDVTEEVLRAITPD